MSKSDVFHTLYLADEAATLKLAEDIAVILRHGDVIALSGDLGMGKTTFARALIRNFLGDLDAEVPSPTFTLFNSYEGARGRVSHFDLYRLSDVEELEEIGFDEALESSVCLIEWPERGEEALPDDALWICFEAEKEGRSVSFKARGVLQERVERTLDIRRFLDENGWKEARRSFFQGDASVRSYETIAAGDGTEAVLMNAPERTGEPVVRDGKRYSQLACLAESVGPFVAIGETLKENGFATPELYAQDLRSGLLLMEDLGRDGVLAEGGPIAERYRAAMRTIAAMHAVDWPRTIPLSDGSAHYVPAFNFGIVEIEINLISEWYAPKILGEKLPAEASNEFVKIWRELFAVLESGEKSLFLRDFHSPNIIWRGDKEDHQRVGLIDYQDALFGTVAYDVASLAQDARVTVPQELEQELVDIYIQERKNQPGDFDEEEFLRDYAIIAAERGTRLIGLWPRLKYRDRKPNYMRHMPRTKDYLKRTLSHPVLHQLKDWYDVHLPL